MSTAVTERLFRGSAAIALALLTLLAMAAPALAKPGAGHAGGNAEAAAACEDGGYANWVDATGNGFRNEGACVSYAAHGGTLVPVEPDPVSLFSVSYAPSGTNGFVATLTGSGLEPDSTVDLFFTWGDTTTFLGSVADASGGVTFTASANCASAGSPLTAVAAAGTPVGGEHTEFSLQLPDASICRPAT
jgi:hypothetical protein